MSKKTIHDINVTGKRVLVRCDFNVPQDKETGEITNDRRIVAALPTIKYLLEHGAKVILCSHLKKPKGKLKPELSLAPVAKRLSEYLGVEVKIGGAEIADEDTQAGNILGDDTKELVNEMNRGEAILLENVRFDPKEEANDPNFAKELASLADIYVNDAFGTAHRAHASTAGVAEYLPAVSGLLMKEEIEALGKCLNNPEPPFVAILGGAKISSKIGVIESLMDKANQIIIGGGMAFPFLKALEYDVGDSFYGDTEEEREKAVEMAKDIMKKANEKGVKLIYPEDMVCANAFSNDAERQTVNATEIPDGWQGLDIGPKTVAKIANILKTAKTVVWNGPMGVFEFPNFAGGTEAVAKEVEKTDAQIVIGGGDSVAAVEKVGYVVGPNTHISTGGGATLEFLEGKDLPGVAGLQDKEIDKEDNCR